jgi:hypothetical protein
VSEKPKRKRSEQSTLLRYFRRTLPFEFVAPLSLEECIAHLKSQDTPIKFFKRIQSSAIEVRVSPVAGNVCQFIVQREKYHQLNVTAVGTLEELGPSSTLVKAEVSQSELSLLLFPVIVGAFCLLWPIAPFIAGYYFLRRYSSELEVANLIKFSLGVPPDE